MTLQEQVVSLELAKKLKELGVPQESYFHWAKSAYNGEYYVTTEDSRRLSKEQEFHDMPGAGDFYDLVSAYTVGELGEMLPERIKIKEGLAFLTFCKLDGKYKTYYEFLTEKEWFHSPLMESKTFADSVAKMLIYLIENKLLPIPGRE